MTQLLLSSTEYNNTHVSTIAAQRYNWEGEATSTLTGQGRLAGAEWWLASASPSSSLYSVSVQRQ